MWLPIETCCVHVRRGGEGVCGYIVHVVGARGGVSHVRSHGVAARRGGEAGHATGAAWSVHARAPSRAVLFSAYFRPVASGLIFCSLSGLSSASPPPHTYSHIQIFDLFGPRTSDITHISYDLAYANSPIAHVAHGHIPLSMHGYGFIQ